MPFLSETVLSLQSGAHFGRPRLPKCPAPLIFELSQFSSANQTLATILYSFADNFCKSSPEPSETKTLVQRPWEPLSPPKKTTVSRPIMPDVFTHEYTCDPTVALPS